MISKNSTHLECKLANVGRISRSQPCELYWVLVQSYIPSHTRRVWVDDSPAETRERWDMELRSVEGMPLNPRYPPNISHWVIEIACFMTKNSRRYSNTPYISIRQTQICIVSWLMFSRCVKTKTWDHLHQYLGPGFIRHPLSKYPTHPKKQVPFLEDHPS